MANSIVDDSALISFGSHFDVFRQNTTVISSTAECLQKYIPQIISDILSKEDLKKMAVLGIGSFNGEQDLVIIDIIDKLLKKEIPFQYTAVDPCAPALDEFEKSVEEFFKPNERKITFEKKAVQFQTFMKTSQQTKAYDFIHFIHCANYMEMEKALVHCFDNELKDDGKIMIIVSSKSSFIKAISNKFRVTKIPCDFKSYHFYSSDEIEEIAKKYGWNIEMFPYSFQLDCTECFTGSVEGDTILQHLVKGDFRQHATPEIREEVEEDLMKFSVETNGRFIATEPCEVLLLTKNDKMT